MKKIIIAVLNSTQLILLKLVYFFSNAYFKKNNDSWVVVGAETASMLKNISNALSGSRSVNFAPNRFYDFKYTYEIYSKNIFFKFFNLFYTPLLLGYLSSRYKKFIYLGSAGFLMPYTDGRQKEFKFLKSKNRKLVCCFMGSEIRSFKLLEQYAKQEDIDVITTYQSISHLDIDSAINENKRKQLAEVADEYADKIINPPIDQMAYIKQITHPFIYFLPDNLFKPSLEKFNDLNEIIVLHGPSSPIIKGTPLVRAAIKKLKVEGYRFKYVELINVPNEKMLKELENAHIVLNQFYAFVPSVFGLEAMANHCVLLTSADENIETTLPCGANKAWCVTPYWNIYDNLKNLLDNPEQIKSQASAGFKWAKENYQYDAAVKKLNEIVND